MTVLIETAKVAYLGDGVTTGFVYPFRILEDDDLLVTVESSGTSTLVLNVDYTVTGTGSTNGGSIVLAIGGRASAGSTLTIQRNMEATQETDFVDGEAFSAEAVETALDKAFMVIQQQKNLIAALSARLDALPVYIVAGSGSSATPVIIDTSASDVVVNLPASGTVSLINGGANGYGMVLTPSGTDTIQMQATARFEGYQESVTFVWIAGNWYKIG